MSEYIDSMGITWLMSPFYDPVGISLILIVRMINAISLVSNDCYQTHQNVIKHYVSMMSTPTLLNYIFIFISFYLHQLYFLL